MASSLMNRLWGDPGDFKSSSNSSCSMSDANVNPYESTGIARTRGAAFESSQANTATLCHVLLVGFPLFTACTFLHSCMCGHLQHATSTTMPIHVTLDIVLALVFVTAVLIAFRSTIKHPKVFAALLALIYLDHVILANGAGYLFVLIDLPIMGFVAVRCFKRLRDARFKLLTVESTTV